MTARTETELQQLFEDAAHEIFGDASQYLETRTHDGHIEYVKGEVNSSWVFFKAGVKAGEAEAPATAPTDGGSDKVKGCLRFIRQCVSGRRDELDLEVM